MAWHSSLAPRDCRFFFFVVNPPVMSFVSKCRCARLRFCRKKKKKIGREIHDLKRKKKKWWCGLRWGREAKLAGTDCQLFFFFFFFLRRTKKPSDLCASISNKPKWNTIKVEHIVRAYMFVCVCVWIAEGKGRSRAGCCSHANLVSLKKKKGTQIIAVPSWGSFSFFFWLIFYSLHVPCNVWMSLHAFVADKK